MELMRNRYWNMVKRQLRKGEVGTVTVLNSLAVEVDKLAELHEGISTGADVPSPSQVRLIAKETAVTLRQMGDNIKLHALSHAGEAPVKVTEKEAAMVLAPRKVKAAL